MDLKHVDEAVNDVQGGEWFAAWEGNDSRAPNIYERSRVNGRPILLARMAWAQILESQRIAFSHNASLQGWNQKYCEANFPREVR